MKQFILLTILLSIYQVSWGQVDTIQFENARLNINQLSSGKNTYLHYKQDTFDNAAIYDMSIWERTISKEKNHISLNWRWTMPDSATYVDKKIVVNSKNLKPLNISWSDSSKGKKGYSFAFDFKENMLKSDPDTTKHNYQKLEIPYEFLAYCWELDMETFSTLPLEVGKIFAIPFYHPGGAPPAYYKYEVIGKEALLFADNSITTFVLRHYHKTPTEFTDWWIDQNSFKVVKMKSRYGDTYRYKILIPN